MFLNDSMQAVVILACEKHAPDILEKLNNGSSGNWFIMPPTSVFRTGYWPNVSGSHESQGVAIFGFIERQALAQKMQDFSSANLDNGVCPECAAYEWNITPLHSSQASRDPVCRRVVSCGNSLSENYDHRLYFFCSPSCRDRFHKEPSEFVKDRESVNAS